MNNQPSRYHLDVRALPGTREVIAYKDGGLFPVLALAPNGVILAALRGGAGHLGLDGRIEILRSLDTGLSWSPPNVIADSERDDRNPAFGLSNQGTLILAYHCQGNYDAEGNYLRAAESRADRVDVMVTRSHDAGLTWEKPYQLGVDALRSGSPFGKIVALADGALLMAIYHANGSFLVHSHDDGASWAEPVLLAEKMNETALVCLPNGELMAVMRGEDEQQALHSTHSTDGGFTWSPPVQITGARQHPADLVLLSNGALLLTYGNRTPPYQIEGLVSRDNGHTWLDCLLTFSGPLYGYNLDSPRPTDLGYPSSVVGTDLRKGVTLYYYNPSVNKPWNWAGREHEARYAVHHYYAIAVHWDEAELIAALEQRVGT
jgi:hypothetical protein